MLQILRTRAQGVLAWIIVLFVGAAFTFFGLGDYFSRGGSSDTAAKVGDQKISWHTVDAVYKRVAFQYGNQVAPEVLKNQILMQLIRRLALIKDVRSLGFQVGDQQVAEFLIQIPTFQADGKFSKEQYLKTLADANYTEVGFRQELTQDLLLGQLEHGINQSSFVTPTELKNTVGLVDQKRDFGYMVLSANKYKKDIKISEDQIKAYYEQHKASLVKPEQVVLEYVELSLSKLSEKIKLTPAEISDFYEAHQAAFTTPERVHARHILISVPPGDTVSEAKAKTKIEAIFAELKQGADFSKIAKNVSADVGSAKNGGDLGWFVRGQMVPEFEKAAFELKSGSISSPIRTQFGYHLIQTLEHKNTEVRPLNAVKALVEAQLKREKAEVLFAEKIEALAKLGSLQPTLDPVAEQLGLKKEESVSFGREGGTGITNNPEVIKAAFSDALLKEKHNSEPIKVSDDVTVVIRVKNYVSAAQETLAEAHTKITDHLVVEGARERAKSIGESILKKMQTGAKPSDLAEQQALTWTVKSNVIRAATDPKREIVAAVFQMPEYNSTPEKPHLNGFSLPSGDYLVLALNKVKGGDWASLTADIQDSYKKGLTEFSSQFEYGLYASQVLQAAKVKLFNAAS